MQSVNEYVASERLMLVAYQYMTHCRGAWAGRRSLWFWREVYVIWQVW